MAENMTDADLLEPFIMSPDPLTPCVIRAERQSAYLRRIDGERKVRFMHGDVCLRETTLAQFRMECGT